MVVAYDVTRNPTCKEIPLSRRKILKKTIVGNVILIIVAVFIVIFYPILISMSAQTIFPGLVMDDFIVMATSLVIIFAILATNLVYHYLYYKRYYYDLKKDVLVIRKGVFIPKEISIPLDKIQDVYVDRDTMDLLFGLYDVHVSSATIQSGVDAHIDGVKQDGAAKLREMMFENMQKVKSKKTIGG